MFGRVCVRVYVNAFISLFFSCYCFICGCTLDLDSGIIINNFADMFLTCIELLPMPGNDIRRRA